MPEDKPRTGRSNRDYTKAKKVTSIPEGYVKEVGPDGKEYFVKESASVVRKPGIVTPPSAKPVTPKTAVVTGTTTVPVPIKKPGITTAPRIKPQIAEDILYVEPETTKPIVAENTPAVGQRIGATFVPKRDAGQAWDEYSIADPNGQANMNKTVYVDPNTKKVVDVSKWTPETGFTNAYTGEMFDDARQGALRSDAQEATMQPNFDANGNPITNKIKVPTIINAPEKQGTKGATIGGGFKGGGKIKAPCMNKGGKIKSYVTGGWVDENGQPVTEIPEGYSDKQLSALGWKQTGATNSTGGIDKSQISNSALALGTGVLSGLAAKQGQQKGDYQTIDTTDPLVAGTATAGLNAVIPGAGTAVGAGLKAKDMAIGQLSQVDDTTGKYKNKNQAYGAGLIDAAYKATPLGMAQTALDKDKTFGEKALSIGTLGIADIVKSKKNIDEMETANSGKVSTEQNRIKSEAAISEAMRKRNAGEFAGGGLIKGKGGPKDDAIDAKVKAGSFVVPAENVDKAKEIKKLIMKHAPSLKKANLNQKGGTQVKLSNGEMLISPKEVEKIEDKLGEKVWDKLAPNAAKMEDMSEGEMNEMELAHGGLTPDKARIMLHDGTINGKPITDKQRRYFGYVSGLADGGRVKGETQTQYVARMKKESANKPATKTTTTKVKTAPKTGKTKFEPTIDVNEETIVPGQITDTNYLGNPTKSELNKEVYNIPDSTIGTTGATDTPVNTSGGVKTGGKEILDIGTAINYGLPLAQAGIGIKNLLNAGKRPVDKLDPAYNASVERAIGDSRFGFSAEEKFALDQQNQGLTNSQRYNARNLSGGSAANALANERAAINSSYGRGLETTIRGKEIQQEKKRYADAMVADRQEKSRRLFGDTMNAWQQNQSANAGLVNSGISNLIGASRYNSELEAQKNINSARTSYLNSF